MFGFLNSSKEEDAPEQAPPTDLPELEYFTPEFVQGITDNLTLTKAFAEFQTKFTSNDETITQMKEVLRALIPVLPLLKNTFDLTLPSKLNDCVNKLLTIPLYQFPDRKITEENLNDLKIFSEILLVLHYVLQEQVQKNLNNFMGTAAEQTIRGLIFTLKKTSALKIQNLEEGLSITGEELLRWQAVIKQRLDLYEQIKMLEAAKKVMIDTIRTEDNLSLPTLFEGIEALTQEMSRYTEPCQHLKTIKRNTFLIEVLDALREKKIQGEELESLVSTLNTSNAGLKVGRTEVADVGEEEFENIGTRLSCESLSADSKYQVMLMQKKYYDIDSNLIILPTGPSPENALPESPGSDDDEEFVDCNDYQETPPAPERPDDRGIPHEHDDFVEASDKDAARVQDSTLDTVAVGAQAPAHADVPAVQHNPTNTLALTAASATSRPFLNARRRSEIMVSSTSLIYAGGVGLEALGQISFVSVIEPAFVAASFVSPVALIALSACALVVLIGIGEAAYSYTHRH